MEAASGNARSSKTRPIARTAWTAGVLLAVAVSFAGVQKSFANGPLPDGGAFVAGTGTITPVVNGLVIAQSSSRGIITWTSFSIDAGQGVQFNNGTGATLNRVTGVDISNIAGSLNATGTVYLVNPNGVLVLPTGQIITNGSFIASTRDIATLTFMNALTPEFIGTSTGTVVNQGTITSSNGDAVLIGKTVRNDGYLNAPKGTAGLAAGNDVVLLPVTGNQRLVISAGGGDVTNTGTIAAAQVELNAATGNVYALAGNNGGIVRATGTATILGAIWLTAKTGVNISGKVEAKLANGSGGAVTVRSNSLTISSGGSLKAGRLKMTNY